MQPNARAWSLPSVIDFFEGHRATTSEVYPSEWFFLKDLLREGMSVLDIGCAQGGFSAIVGEHLKTFTYTGVDISPAMVERARAKYPAHRFERVGEDDLSPLGGESFDLVLCLGILHLNERWRGMVSEAWKHTRGALLLDLRETSGASLEDKAASYFKMDFNGDSGSELTLPYNVINAGDALRTLEKLCGGSFAFAEFGYRHPVRGSAVSPVTEVLMKTYCIKRPEPRGSRE